MASRDYHDNDFIFKTMTVFRIVAGVALTLAVLFAMVWLIDYSSIRTPSKKNQQSLLLPGQHDAQKPQEEQTLFESLLNKRFENKSVVAGQEKNQPERRQLPGRSEASPAVSMSEPSPVESGSESIPEVTSPALQPNVSVPHVPPAAPHVESQPASSSVPASQSLPAGEVFAVQLGSFHEAERARVFLENLAVRGYQPYVMNIAMPDGTITYRVRIGRFATREEAISMAARIESTEKISVFVTSK
jgi:cell division septation protein DedD